MVSMDTDEDKLQPQTIPDYYRVLQTNHQGREIKSVVLFDEV